MPPELTGSLSEPVDYESDVTDKWSSEIITGGRCDRKSEGRSGNGEMIHVEW